MERAVTPMEIVTRAPLLKQVSFTQIIEVIESLTQQKLVFSKNGFLVIQNRDSLLESRTKQDFLLDIKWKKLMKMATWFRYIPFVDFVLVSGSMSFGAIRKSSDFDVVLGVRQGRIFTARYLVSGLFSLFRARRLDDFEASSPDKFCFNHIITPISYEKPPHNYYRYELYKHLIPIFIDGLSYERFREKNSWAEIGMLNSEMVPLHKPSKIKKILEFLFGNTIGNYIETHIAEPIAKKRLASYIHQKHNAGRVVIHEYELEFHFQLNYESMFSNFRIPIFVTDTLNQEK